MAEIIGPDQVPPIHRPFDPDDIIEFHAARILLLLAVCGEGKPHPSIDGRTKLAKLDFFLRYPRFLERAQQVLKSRNQEHSDFDSEGAELEASMIRYRYGPWDPRYPSVLAFLESRGLVTVRRVRAHRIGLTAKGVRLANDLLSQPSFGPLRERSAAMIGNLATWSGTDLKDFVYEIFGAEVGDLRLRDQIKP